MFAQRVRITLLYLEPRLLNYQQDRAMYDKRRIIAVAFLLTLKESRHLP